jgi:DNA-binding response OmpR family regulator
MKPKILVVEDDSEILNLVSLALTNIGSFDVSQATTLAELDKKLKEEEIELIVLDVNLPDGNGIYKCRDLRKDGIKTPIILATAATDEIDRILGLEHGADDYLGKPYSPRELVARINAILRRVQNAADAAAQTDANAVYQFEGFTLDTAARTVVRQSDSDPITFTSAEFDVLQCFMKRPNQPISRQDIIKMTHGRESNDPYDRSVDVLVSRIRKALEQAGARDDLFKTIRNGGYQITAKIDKRATGN